MGGGAGGGAATVMPQFPQNAAPGARVEPQLGHKLTLAMVTGAKETSGGANGVPHSVQKVDPSRFTVPQCGQVAMGTSLPCLKIS
jgi:hypothetical protein